MGLHASLSFLLSSFSFFFGAFPNSFGRYNSDFFASSFAAARTTAAMCTATGATYCSRLSSHRPRGVVSVTRDPHYRHERPEYTPQPPCHNQRSSPLTLTHPDFREALLHVLPPPPIQSARRRHLYFIIGCSQNFLSHKPFQY